MKKSCFNCVHGGLDAGKVNFRCWVKLPPWVTSNLSPRIVKDEPRPEGWYCVENENQAERCNYYMCR